MITRKKILVILILALLSFEDGMSMAINDALDFQDCGSKYDIISLDIANCYSIPCGVTQGNLIEITYELEKTLTSDTDSVTFEAYWLVSGTQYTAFILPDNCNLGDCLSISDNRMQFTVLLYVPEIMPSMSSGSLYWRTMNAQTREMISCSRVPIYTF
ncbi:unnamed protein product [Chironomus riparius]|uniref:MD-2-related lipid-recognition domain-containing protein n=1 Tax=Chironomus riparius TaxID=315576 RepID=A0A9N9WZ11_9DIPT|nr:unnamed protein product [Chironomus riparius]